MGYDPDLLIQFVSESPFQPATALWRTVEISHVVRFRFPEGLGLDLGCGDGQLTQVVLRQVGYRVIVGVDPDPAEIALAERLGLYERLYTVASDRVPLPDATFDWVFSNSVLEHIDGIDAVLREVSRLLKPRGLFLFTVPSDGFHGCLRGPLLPWTSRDSYLKKLDARLAHKRYWSEPEWSAALARHGLEVETVTSYLSPREVRRWETISRLTVGILYALFRGRKQPIEIQRALGMRKALTRMPSLVAHLLAGLLTFNLPFEDGIGPGEPSGCLMVRARKR